MKNNIFSGRALDYDKFRIPYPLSLIDFFSTKIKLNHKDIIADIGSGTGLLSALLLSFKAQVFGVEPNRDMRAIGEKRLGNFTNFKSICGSAENTGLLKNSVNMITAGNAFHWFEPKDTRKEFERILKPRGLIMLIRTDWKNIDNLAMKNYDEIINCYCEGRKGMVSDYKLEQQTVSNFFDSHETINLGESTYLYDRSELKGRFLSTSFSPKEGHPDHENAMKEIDILFNNYAVGNKFPFIFSTTVVCGKIEKCMRIF